MKKGYYISAFVCFNELQNVLNIKLRHDQAIALWFFDGFCVKLLKYWELERYSGYKQHAKALYNKEVFYQLLILLLAEENLTLSDIVEIWGTKGIETDISYRTHFLNSGICFHSIAHLMTSLYYGNSYPINDTILSLNLDAGPDSQFETDAYDKKYYAGCVIKNKKISIFPIESPAKLWSYAFKKFGLREGTLMALATAMETNVKFDISRYDNLKFEDVTGRNNARKILNEISDYVNSIAIEDLEIDTRYSEYENRLSAIMKIITLISKQIVSRVIEKIANEYDLNLEETILALAGGFSLNCPTNSYILNKYHFKNYQIPPCTSDTGIAAGIGLARFYVKLKNIPIFFNTPYYGNTLIYNQNIFNKYKKYIKKIDYVSSRDIAQDIIDKKIIVWVNGNAEIGPRALGNRSLLADPRSIKVKNKLNQIKKRQWWRPVAPIILDEFGNDYFENYKYSPNMLLNFKIKKNKKVLVPAIIHHDDTARVQSVSKESNSILYDLLTEFYNKTGIPILCNTSLNDSGEPIINTLEEAIQFALHKGLRYIYCNGKIRIILKGSKKYLNQPFSLRNEPFFHTPKGINAGKLIKKYNPFNLSYEELTYYFDNPNLFLGISLSKKKDVEIIKYKTKAYLISNPDGLKR